MGKLNGRSKSAQTHSKDPEKKPTGLSKKLSNHELFTKVPEMCIPYSVKSNKKGNVFFINEELCQELGLLDVNFSKSDVKHLKKEVLEHFNLQIINDYERLNHTRVKSKDVKPYLCFATRYLQLQHKNQQGRTSGDGRAIWNGTVTSNTGITWDISSRGTGVTSLAPGLVEAGVPLPTGSTDFGYSCGLSEMHEVYTSIVMSERFHQMGFSTERILAGIDIGNGLGICVRAAKNLIRPAHLFRYLKLNDHHGAKTLLDHVIDRDHSNGKFKLSSHDDKCYDEYLKYFSQNFSNLCAKAKHSEVFVWLDWDGDNILIDGGIIDYGSIRQFGAHHNKYKYKDDDRFSTNLDGQIKKAKLTVQIFSQLVDFVKTGKKKSLKKFKNGSCVDSFEKEVYRKELSLFLQDLGLSKAKSNATATWKNKFANDLYTSFLKLKRKKSSTLQPSDDGVNAWPLLNMNHVLADAKKHSKEIDFLRYKTEFTSFKHNKPIPKKEITSFLNSLTSFEKEMKFDFKYQGDASERLTTSALLHIVDLITQAKTPTEKRKIMRECIQYGFKKKSSWIAEIKSLYRDEL